MKRSDLLTSAVLFSLSIVIVWPIITHDGIPALHHDWSWPADPSQARAQARTAFSPTIPDNFGSLNFYQNNAAFWALSAILESTFGADLALRIFVCAIVGTAALAVYGTLRYEFAITNGTSAASGLFYAGNAIVANRLAAGHLTYLIAYAVFPIVVWQLLKIARSPARGPWFGLIAVMPLALVHPQFIVFPMMAAVPILFFTPRRRWGWLLFAAALPLCLSPYIVAVAVSGSPAHDLTFERTTLHWEMVNSATLRDAFDLSNGGYDRMAPAPLLLLRTIALTGLWIFAVVGAIRNARVRPFFLIAAFGVAMHWGLNGPLVGVLSYAFTHFLAASLFRELYHFAVFSALGVAVCAASAFPRTDIPVAALAILATLPQWTGVYFDRIAFERDRDIGTIAKIIGADANPGYVAFLPMLQPLGPDPSHSGDDPQAFAFPGHATVHEFMPQSPMVQLDLMLRRHPQDAASTFRAYGVRYVVIRPTWSSYYETSQEPALRELLQNRPAIAQNITSIAKAMHVVWRGEHTLLARIDDSEGQVHGPPFSNLRRYEAESYDIETPVVTDPRSGWVDALRWFWWVPENAVGFPFGILTASSEPLRFKTVGTHSTVYAWTRGRARVAAASEPAILDSDTVRGTSISGSRGTITSLDRRLTGLIGIGAADTASRDATSACCPLNSSDTLEAAFNRSLGYTARVDGKELDADPSAWDLRVRVPHGRSAVITSAFVERMARFEWLQYASWMLSAACATFLFTRALWRKPSREGRARAR